MKLIIGIFSVIFAGVDLWRLMNGGTEIYFNSHWLLGVFTISFLWIGVRFIWMAGRDSVSQ